MAVAQTITQRTAVTAGNLTDAAVFPVDDANANTRKATIAQLRTQLNTFTQSTANTAYFTYTGHSLTGSNATTMLSFAGTWNTSGTPTALKVAITNTGSNAASLLLNLLAGSGGTTSMFSVGVAGAVSFAGDLAINTSKFTVAASSGNTVVAGTLNVTGGTTASTIDTTGTITSAPGNGFRGLKIAGGAFVSLYDATNTEIVREQAASGVMLYALQQSGGSVQYRDSSANAVLTVTDGGYAVLGTMATTNAVRSVLCLTNATAPSGSPSGGGFVWVESGALKYRGTSGTVTTVAPA